LEPGREALHLNSRFIVHTERDGKLLQFTTSLAVNAAGRTADLSDMGLEKINVSVNKKGVIVNDYLQSVSNKNVYSCGDANDKGLLLTPVGAKEAIVLAMNAGMKAAEMKKMIFSYPTNSSDIVYMI